LFREYWRSREMCWCVERSGLRGCCFERGGLVRRASWGKFASFAEAAAGLVCIERTFQPEGKNAALYEDLFSEYRRGREMG
jgi:hypothetical protein